MLELLDRAARAALRLRGVRSRRVQTSVGEVAALVLTSDRPGGGRFVLVHGLGTSAAGYASVIRRLAPHASSIVALDLPGHGRSARLDRLTVSSLSAGVREAVPELIEDPAVFLGTSLGGAAVLRVALERPDWVHGLVLASPAGAPMTDAELAALRARFDLRSRRDARRFLGQLLHHRPGYLWLIEPGLRARLTSPAVRSFLAQASAADAFTPEELRELRPPVTLFWGRSDEILPRSGLAFYRRALPADARIIEVDEVGHSPHVEAPAMLVDALRSAWAAPSR